MTPTDEMPPLTAKLQRSSHGFELVGGPLVLGLIAYWIESRFLHTAPIVTVIVVVLGAVGASYRLYVRYCEEMAEAGLQRRTSITDAPVRDAGVGGQVTGEAAA